MSEQQGDALPEHVRRNREIWDAQLSPGFAARARKQWSAQPHWGIWSVPQRDVPLLPENLAGKDVIELGCGTAYVCAWVARAGGKPVGIDNSEAQLAVAGAMQDEFNLHFPLLHGNAEDVPYPNESFDLVISEQGASAWCDPFLWIPEAARLLRPSGALIFMRNSDLLTLCSPADDDGPADTTLHRSQRDLLRLEEDNGAVHFHLPHGPMIRLLRDYGFVVEDLIDAYAREDSPIEFEYATKDWALRWPSEEIWKARLVGRKTPI